MLRIPIFIAIFCLLSHSLVDARTQAKGQLVLSTNSDPKTFNPIVSNETSSSLITGILFEGLTREDPFSLKVLPNLAESWSVSKDGLRWVFKLRPDILWFDGVPLTADDVVFTFQAIYDPGVLSSSKDIFMIDGKKIQVEKMDDNTVSFTLPAKFAPFLRSLSQPILPKHCLLKKLKEGKFNFTWGIDTMVHDIVGTGPFYLDAYYPGEKIILKRNPHYWKTGSTHQRLPYLDKVIFLIIPDPDANLLKFLDNELDYVPIRGGDYPLLKPQEKKKNFTLYEAGPNFGSSFIVFNQNTGHNPKTGKAYLDPVKLSWFKNVEFRHAIAHAIDKEKIIQVLYNGLGYPQNGPESPSSSFFYNPDVRTYPFDLPKAKEILEKAGFILKNGQLYDPKEHPVQFNLYTSSSGQHSQSVQMAYMIRSDLEKLGIKVNFQMLEFNTLVAKLMSGYDWDAIIIGLTGGVEPHFGRNVWASAGQLHIWNPKQQMPATEWEKRLDEIFDQASVELDENKRKVLYDEYQQIAAEQLPMIYTVLAANIYAVRNRFGNLKPSAYAGAFHNLEEIYIKK